MTLSEVLTMIGPAVAVYAAIRVDIALLKLRVETLEKHNEKHHSVRA